MFRPAISISRVRVSILLLVLSSSSSSSAAAAAEISYATHCSSTVPESRPTDPIPSSLAAFELINGYFSGGDGLLGSAEASLPRFFFFKPQSLRRTSSPAVLSLAGTLALRGGPSLRRNRTLSRVRFRPHLPRTISPRGKASFDLSGYYSEATGMLCMVGAGRGRSSEGNLLDISAVFKLNFPRRSNITTSVASGTLQAYDNGSTRKYNPISLLVYTQKEYEYTQLGKVEGSCSRVRVDDAKVGLSNTTFCDRLRPLMGVRFRLDSSLNSSGLSLMSVNQVQCTDEGRLHMAIGFSDPSSSYRFGVLQPGRALVGEGVWDWKRSRLCVVAFCVADSGNPLLGWPIEDCNIGFSLWFPAVYTIERQSSVVGHIWSNRDESDSAYFVPIAFRSVGSASGEGSRYEFTKIDAVRKSCVEKKSVWKVGKTEYPNGNSYADMRFRMSVSDSTGRRSWGHATPFSVGNRFYNQFNEYSSVRNSAAQEPEHGSIELNQNLMNISYKIVFNFPNASISEVVHVSAEGVYNAETGLVCMVGCRSGESVVTEQVKTAHVLDCAILINIQFSPLNSKGLHLVGKMRSTREKSDPYFFEPLEISSYGLYTRQAAESISRMDIEITMVLVSLTLSCVFIGLQLFHIKKNPHVLPSISITMLAVLTLCHMIPLLLNFEALFFMKRNRQNVLEQSGGWLEVNEVLVRIITMVAFLLQARLLQVALSARSGEELKKVFWIGERKSLLICLPVYFAVGLIAWFVHLRSNGTQQGRSDYIASHHHSLWEGVKSFAGFVLDGFLLPQIILNVFLNTKDKALVPAFYIGTTMVRALPHVYDAYRAHYYVSYFKSSYIYANPDGDLYSSAWDIIIPCEGLVFAALVFFQQQFGGTFRLSSRSRPTGEYEMVPVVSQ